MARVTCVVAGLVVGWLVCANAATGDYFGAVEPDKLPTLSSNGLSHAALPSGLQGGGDTFGSATVIPSLPYFDGGSTCAFANDYYPECAFQGNSAAPDVVYKYTPQASTCVDIALCGSSFDTVLHVYDGAQGALVACDDDGCAAQSRIQNLHLSAGIPYYIVVDGWGTDCGNYSLAVRSCTGPCEVTCVGGTPEGEPACFDGYTDQFNGGCNATPPAFQPLTCNDAGVTVCGHYGTYLGATGRQLRDTDWYEITLTGPTLLECCVVGEVPTQLAVLGASCNPVTVLCGSVFGEACAPMCCQVQLTAGQYRVFVAPSIYSGYPCDSDYELTIHGYQCPTVGVEPAHWGTVKRLFR
jgi:hypothetical protein